MIIALHLHSKLALFCNLSIRLVRLAKWDVGSMVTDGKAIHSFGCRCRNGVFHVVNNNYEGWGMYAIGGSAFPTINSEGNRFFAPDGSNMKEVSSTSFTTFQPYSPSY